MFFWSRTADDLAHFISNAYSCWRKDTIKNRSCITPVRPYISAHETDLFRVSQFRSRWESLSLLVVTDNLSGTTQAYVTRKYKGKTAAESLFSDFMLTYQMSSKILHDTGGKFGKLCLVSKMRSTPYHFKTIGKVEIMNQTIISMLRTLPHLYKSKRKD